MASVKQPPAAEADIDNFPSTQECKSTWTDTSPLQQLAQTVKIPRLPVREPCPICRQPCFPAVRITLPCNHAFCASCLSLWLSTTDRPACPLCWHPYPYNLYPLLIPGLAVALPANMPISTALKITAWTILPPWVILFIPATAFVYCTGLMSPTSDYQSTTVVFHLLGPFLAAWLWICLLVAWRSSDYCRYANRLRREKGRSILSLVNRAPWFLYMWGEVVLVPIWMSNGILMMLGGMIVKLGVVVIGRWVGVWD